MPETPVARIAPRAPWLAPLLLVVAATGCAPRHEPDRAASAGPPVRVRLVSVESRAFSEGQVLAGRVRAAEEVTLSATVRARLTALPYAEGAAFPAGAVLARFESTEARLEWAAARAAERAAAARRDEARRQEARIDSLFATRVVAQRDLDVAASAARIAEATHDEARARAALLEAGLQIRAPFAGVVARQRVDVGAQLEPGAPVLAIRSRGAHEIEVAIPESEVARAAAGRPWFRIGGGAWREARVDRLEGMTDYASRTRIAYLVSPHLAGIEPGAYAEVRFDRGAQAVAAPAGATALEADEGGAMLVPASTLVRRGGLTGVYVAREGKARLRWVRLGRAEGEGVEVLAGLWPGERLVRDPRGLEDGRAIEVTP